MFEFVKKWFKKPAEVKPKEKSPETKIAPKSECKIKTPDEIEECTKKHGRSASNEKAIKQLFVGKCWEYLNDNFHKFSEPNKIKIALELCKKDIPTELSGEFTQKVIMENVTIGSRKMEYNLGS